MINFRTFSRIFLTGDKAGEMRESGECSSLLLREMPCRVITRWLVNWRENRKLSLIFHLSFGMPTHSKHFFIQLSVSLHFSFSLASSDQPASHFLLFSTVIDTLPFAVASSLSEERKERRKGENRPIRERERQCEVTRWLWNDWRGVEECWYIHVLRHFQDNFA